MDKINKKSNDLSKKMLNMGGSLTKGLTLPMTALGTLGLKYNMELETYASNLTVLMNGNEKQANDLLKTIKDMAKVTPYETSTLIDATQTMMQFGIESDNALKYLNQIGDIAMGDANKMESLTLAFSQVSSAGKLSGQDLLQMINAGFNPLSIISEKTGKSMATLKEEMSDGAISAEMVAQAFQWATEEGGLFYQGMQKGSETTSGKLSTLKDSFQEALGALTEALLPVFEKLVESLIKVADWFGNLDDKQRILILGILGFAAAIGPILSLIGTLITVVQGLSAAFSFLAANPVVLIIAAVVALVAAIIYCYNKFEWFRDGLNAIFKGIANVFIWLINLIISGINLMIGNFLAPINAMIKALNLVPGINIKTIKVAIPKIPYLDTGTNYVQQEGLAYLHQGEAVVPKKYNPAVGGYGNMNITLNSVIELDGQKVGRTVTPYVANTIKNGGGI